LVNEGEGPLIFATEPGEAERTGVTVETVAPPVLVTVMVTVKSWPVETVAGALTTPSRSPPRLTVTASEAGLAETAPDVTASR